MSTFLSVQCDCGQQAVVFGDSKLAVHCAKCGNVLVKPQGGRAKINCRILEVLS